MKHLKNLGVKTIRLEAVPEAFTLYQRLGFDREIDSLRFCKELKRKLSHVYSFKKEIRPLVEEDLKN